MEADPGHHAAGELPFLGNLSSQFRVIDPQYFFLRLGKGEISFPDPLLDLREVQLDKMAQDDFPDVTQ